MRLLLISAFLIGSVLGVVPLAAASPSFDDISSDIQSYGDITVSVASKRIDVSWQGAEIAGNTSNWLRDKVDGIDGSERDGVVSEDEAASGVLMIKEFLRQEFDRYANDHDYSGLLLIGNTEPQAAEVRDLAADGIVGNVDSGEPITLSFLASIAFPTRASDVHSVKLDIGRYYFRSVNESRAEEMVGDMSLTISGGSGWSIDGSTIQPDCARENFDNETGAMVFTTDDLNCFTEHTGVLLAFSITGHEDDSTYKIPGPGLPLAVLAIGAVAYVARRK